MDAVSLIIHLLEKALYYKPMIDGTSYNAGCCHGAYFTYMALLTQIEKGGFYECRHCT